MNFRKLLLTLHLVTGLVSAVLLLVMGLSGSLIAFEGEIDNWLNAPLAMVKPEGQRLPLDMLAARLEAAHPGAKVSGIFTPTGDDLACTVTLRGAGKTLSLAVNPYSGAELGARDQANPLIKKVHQFHTNLLQGPKGKLITGTGAILLLVLSLTGLVLWWPRKMWRMKWSDSGRKRNYDLHHVLGFWSSAFMLIFAMTGIVIHWDDEAKTLVNRMAGETEPPVKKLAAPAAGAVPISAGKVHDIASQTVPGATVTGIMGLGDVHGAVRVMMKYPEDRTPAGRTNLQLDPVTGAVLSAVTSRTAPLGTRVVKLWNREVHTGDIFGLPTRIVACLASLCLPMLALTGPLIWWGRVRRRGQAGSL